MLSYAGVYLGSPPAKFLDILRAQRFRPADVVEFEQRTCPTLEQLHLYFQPPVDHEVKLNTLHWPVGASRWATFHFVASANQLTKIRAAAYLTSDLNKFVSLPLVFDDENGGTITTNMWLLPPRHVAQHDGYNDAYLCTLVDDRFFWWESAALIAVTGGTTTWTGLYSSIATALGITLTPDTVAAAYLMPSTDMTGNYDYLPPLLDAVAHSCGQRIVRLLNGNVLAQNSTTALNNVSTQLATTFKSRAVVGGGRFCLSPPPATPTDLYGLVPEFVVVTFPRSDGGALGASVTPYTVSLLSLSLTQFGSIPGFKGSLVIKANTIAAWAGGGSPTNDTELAALAQQVATDFYCWRLGSLDQRFAGIAAWTPEGFHDIEWTEAFKEDCPDDLPEPLHRELYTHIVRGPWNTRGERIGINGTAGAVDYNISNLATEIAAITPNAPFTGMVALAKLTTLGIQGSLTFTNGVCTGYFPPT